MTNCIRCGDCCEQIYIPVTKAQLRHHLACVDPEDDPDAWTEVGWTVERAVRYRDDARFILAHWRSAGRRRGEKGLHRWSCDMFDSETRLCKAHDARPPVCAGYPWYDRPPSAERQAELSERCSYRADWQPVELTARAG